jgi:hypothetical protein
MCLPRGSFRAVHPWDRAALDETLLMALHPVAHTTSQSAASDFTAMSVFHQRRLSGESILIDENDPAVTEVRPAAGRHSIRFRAGWELLVYMLLQSGFCLRFDPAAEGQDVGYYHSHA